MAYAAPGGYLRAALPAGKLVFGNAATWANSSVTAYSGMLDSAFLEGLVGASYSIENYAGWTAMMGLYKTAMLAQRSPGYTMFSQDGSATNYAGMRYGLCSCLLDNGYYYHSNNGSYDTVELYDEFSFSLGAPTSGPNNLTNGTYSSGGITVYQNGVWRRDFANGIILVNPRGNGAQNVTLEVNAWHLRGTQDSTTNNAAEVTAGTNISMPDTNVAGTGGSGLFMSRTAT